VNQVGNEIPDRYSLSQNYPNPFNPVTKIKFDIASNNYFPLERGAGGMTILKVYNILGKEIATLVNEQLLPGTYEVAFDGSKLSNGVYFYKLSTVNFTDTKRMLLIK
jgi:hypothetical protein